MRHDRDPAPGQVADSGGHLDPALQLDRVAAGFLDDARGIAEGDLGGLLERAERHVHHHQRRGRAPHGRLPVHDHVLQRHAQRVGHAVDHHPETVADQQQIADLVADRGHMGGVGGQADQRLAPLAGHELRDRHAALLLAVRVRDGVFLGDGGLGGHEVLPWLARTVFPCSGDVPQGV